MKKGLRFPLKTISAVSALLLAFVASGWADDYSAREVELFTADGYKVAGRYYYLPGKTGPSLLLLHMLGGTKEDWGDFLPFLKSARITSILMVDLRGHGGSNIRKRFSDGRMVVDTVTWKRFGETDFLDLVNDIEVGWRYLKQQPSTDSARMGIIGASIGANYAAVFASGHADVKSLVMLSPGLVYRGVSCLEAVEKYEVRPLLLVASRDDDYSVRSCRKLRDISTAKPVHLEVLKAGGHGTGILQGNRPFGHLLSSWLRSTL